MENAEIILERHEQRINAIEKEISDLKAVQSEIRSMNETLVTLATELKHTNRCFMRCIDHYPGIIYGLRIG